MDSTMCPARRRSTHGGTPRAPPDHATSEIAIGSNWELTPPKNFPAEGFNRPWPPLIKMDVAVKNKIIPFSEIPCR